VSADGGHSWSNIPRAAARSLKLVNLTAAQDGYEYHAVFSNSAGTATTVAATIHLSSAPSVKTQPTAETVTAGDLVTFTAVASGQPAPSVQWQVSTDNGSTYSPIPGATAVTLSVTPQVSDNGSLYSAVFTNSVGAATTGAAALTVVAPPVVASQPTGQVVSSGQTATFTAAAGGTPVQGVQWQVSTDKGTTWTDIAGATSLTLSITGVSAAQHGNEYRAQFTNSAGTVTTDPATLHLSSAPTSSTQPPATTSSSGPTGVAPLPVTLQPMGQTASLGQTATFTAAASGTPAPGAQWQMSTDTGTTWTNVDGATASTLTFSGVTAVLNGNEYRAVFSNSQGTVTTDAARLVVNGATNVANKVDWWLYEFANDPRFSNIPYAWKIPHTEVLSDVLAGDKTGQIDTGHHRLDCLLLAGLNAQGRPPDAPDVVSDWLSHWGSVLSGLTNNLVAAIKQGWDNLKSNRVALAKALESQFGPISAVQLANAFWDIITNDYDKLADALWTSGSLAGLHALDLAKILVGFGARPADIATAFFRNPETPT
jgi:hypothetical protein